MSRRDVERQKRRIWWATMSGNGFICLWDSRADARLNVVRALGERVIRVRVTRLGSGEGRG